jgi:uncharacterized membrane protein
MARQVRKQATIKGFLGHVLPGVIRPIHALWNEVIGFVFICFAVGAGFSAWRSLRTSTDGDGFKAVVTGIFALLMAFFGISSFLKARKISRS